MSSVSVTTEISELSFEQRDEVVGHRRQRDPHRLRQHHEAQRLRAREPEHARGVELRRGHAREPGAVVLALGRRVVEAEREHARGERRERDAELGQPEVDHDQLHEQRRAAEQLDVADRERGERLRRERARAREQRAERDRERHRERADHEREARRRGERSRASFGYWVVGADPERRLEPDRRAPRVPRERGSARHRIGVAEQRGGLGVPDPPALVDRAQLAAARERGERRVDRALQVGVAAADRDRIAHLAERVGQHLERGIDRAVVGR